MKSAQTGFPLGPALQKNLPEAESVGALRAGLPFPCVMKSAPLPSPTSSLRDSNFFRFFQLPVDGRSSGQCAECERKDCYYRPLLQSDYFDYKGKGDLTPIGKTVVLAQGYTAKISGIAKDAPPDSHFHFTFILSLSSWDDEPHVSWVTGKVITLFETEE